MKLKHTKQFKQMKHATQRIALAMTAALGCALLSNGVAHAQTADYPSKPVRIILSSPGGGTDVMARSFAEHFTRTFGTQFVVESRQPNIAATGYVAKSTPDGYTLLVATASYIVTTLFHKSAPYDPIRDFAPVSLLGTTPIILVVHPSLPVRSVREYIALAKAKPGELNFGSGGIGSPLHLAGELFNQTTGINVMHIPFKGTAAAAIDLQAGRVQAMFPSAISVMPQIRAGRVKVLTIMSDHRSTELPDVPTTKEAGIPNLTVNIWYGMLAPRATPKPILDLLNKAVVAGMARPEIKERMLTNGVDQVGSTPAYFDTFAANERTRWANVIQKGHIEGGE